MLYCAGGDIGIIIN